MKRNIYSKLWMIFFVLMGAACTNQVEDAIPVSGQPIEFSVQSDWKEIRNTRSDDKTQFTQGDSIRIFCFYNEKKKFMYDVADSTRGQIVVLDDDGKTWNYKPKRFWPKEGKLLFLASYPQNSIHNYGVGTPMIYDQTVNPLRRDLLWGVSEMKSPSAQDRKNNVGITMVHALAKVNISIDNSWGNIGTVIVSAYKVGRFTKTYTDGIPIWDVSDVEENKIDATFRYSDLIRNDSGTSFTVFILPDKITGLRMFDFGGIEKINASKEISEEIKKHTFLAGKVYNLTISKGVRKKNTNSRSIAMSVRCVSE